MSPGDLQRKLKGFGRHRLTYWIADPTFQTPSDQDSDVRHPLLKGCDDWLSKPIQDHQLFEKIRQYLKVRYIYSDAPFRQLHSQAIRS